MDNIGYKRRLRTLLEQGKLDAALKHLKYAPLETTLTEDDTVEYLVRPLLQQMWGGGYIKAGMQSVPGQPRTADIVGQKFVQLMKHVKVVPDNKKS